MDEAPPVKPPPKFSVGDRVISFKGELATVIWVRTVDHPGKSHRVSVHWDDSDREDKIEYYEGVFEHV